MKVVIILVAVGLAGVASSAAVPKGPVHLPPYVMTCYRDRPDFNSCIQTSLMNLRPYLVKGVPEFDLPPFDPYKTDESVTEYSNGYIQGRMTIKDSVTYGLAGMQVLDIRTDFSNLNDVKLRMVVFVPKVKSEGKFKVQGKFINSDIRSRGNYEVYLSNVTLTCDILGGVENIDGERYLTVRHFYVKPEVGDLKIYATDLFKGNEALTKAVLGLFNQYWRPVMEELLPHVRDGWDRGLREVSHRVFHRVPFDELFPLSN